MTSQKRGRNSCEDPHQPDRSWALPYNFHLLAGLGAPLERHAQIHLAIRPDYRAKCYARRRPSLRGPRRRQWRLDSSGASRRTGFDDLRQASLSGPRTLGGNSTRLGTQSAVFRLEEARYAGQEPRGRTRDRSFRVRRADGGLGRSGLGWSRGQGHVRAVLDSEASEVKVGATAIVCETAVL